MLPGVSTISFEQFMGVSNLNFRTTNNTSLSIESLALIDFGLKPNTEKIKFPFLITSESVKDPIFGYNLLEYLVASTNFWYINVSIPTYSFRRDRNCSVDY